jgi:acyl-CoA thioesterase-1
MCLDIRNAVVACFIFLVCYCSGCGGHTSNASTNPEPQTMATPSIPAPPPLDARPKLVAFGDSFTAGLGIDDWRKNYPSLLQQDLDAAGFDLQVINRGRSGDTSTEGLARLDEALNVGDARIFVVALGGNDISRNVPLAETKASLAEIIKRAHGKGAKVLLCGYEVMAGAEKAAAVKQMYEELARENSVELLPSFLSGVQRDPNLLQPDGVHPNEAGARVVEQNVWKALQPMLIREPRKKQ